MWANTEKCQLINIIIVACLVHCGFKKKMTSSIFTAQTIKNKYAFCTPLVQTFKLKIMLGLGSIREHLF